MSSWEIITQILYGLLNRRLLFVKIEILFHFNQLSREKYVALFGSTGPHHTLWIISLINRKNVDRMSSTVILGTELVTGWAALAYWEMKWWPDEQQCPSLNWTGGWIGSTFLLGTELATGGAALAYWGMKWWPSEQHCLSGNWTGDRKSSTGLLGNEVVTEWAALSFWELNWRPEEQHWPTGEWSGDRMSSNVHLWTELVAE
jgi:hypothetical protein